MGGKGGVRCGVGERERVWWFGRGRARGRGRGPKGRERGGGGPALLSTTLIGDRSPCYFVLQALPARPPQTVFTAQRPARRCHGDRPIAASAWVVVTLLRRPAVGAGARCRYLTRRTGSRDATVVRCGMAACLLACCLHRWLPAHRRCTSSRTLSPTLSLGVSPTRHFTTGASSGRRARGGSSVHGGAGRLC